MSNLIKFGNLHLTSLNWIIKPQNNPKHLLSAQGEDAVDHNTVTRCFKKFCSDCKNLNNKIRSGKTKTMDSEDIFQARKANQVSSTQRVSGKLGISQSNMVCHHHSLSKSIKLCFMLPKYCKNFWLTLVVPHVTKILQNLWLTLVVPHVNKILQNFWLTLVMPHVNKILQNFWLTWVNHLEQLLILISIFFYLYFFQ